MNFLYSGAGRRSRTPVVFRPILCRVGRKNLLQPIQPVVFSPHFDVCHGTGDLAAARGFMRPSSRDVDRLSSGVRQWGAVAVPRSVVRGPMAIALPRSCSPRTLPRPFCDVRVRYRRLCLRRQCGTPLHPRWQSDSDHVGKRYILGRNRESRLRPGNCVFRPRNAISRELTSRL